MNNYSEYDSSLNDIAKRYSKYLSKRFPANEWNNDMDEAIDYLGKTGADIATKILLKNN